MITLQPESHDDKKNSFYPWVAADSERSIVSVDGLPLKESMALVALRSNLEGDEDGEDAMEEEPRGGRESWEESVTGRIGGEDGANDRLPN